MRLAAKLTAFVAAAGIMMGQQAPGLARVPESAGAGSAAVTGIFNWIHSTADLDRGYAFYHDVFGLEMINPPFGAIPGAPPPQTIRTRAEAIADPLVGDLTNTGHARFRNVFMRLPNAGFGLELSEFNDIETRAVQPNIWDAGATTLILEVRDMDAVMAALRKVRAGIVTVSAKAVDIGVLRDGAARERVRSILVRDPDGYLIQVVQAPDSLRPAVGNEAVNSGMVTSAAIGMTVLDLASARRFYGEILGFELHRGTSFKTDKAVLNLMGMHKGRFRVSASHVPGTRVRVEFYEFRDAGGVPVRLRIQDPGAPQLQLQVRELDRLIDRVREAGYAFVSVGAKPIQRAFGRFVFALDPNGVLVEFVEPAKPVSPVR